jgi:uncharacterized protein (TIGR03435 family)
MFLLASAMVDAQVPPPPPPPPFPATRVTGTTCAVVSPAALKAEFSAASVKPAGPAIREGMGGVTGGPGTDAPGRVMMPRMPVSTLVMLAYDLKRDQLSGPAWIDDGFNDGFAITATMPKATTKEQYCGMLRNLLTDRFHLAVHREVQSRPGYELVVSKSGSKLKRESRSPDSSELPESASIDANSNRFPKFPLNGQPGLRIAMSPQGGVVRMSYRGALAPFATGLGPFITWSAGNTGFGDPNARLVDKTGLDGVYEIRLEFAGPQPNSPGTEGVDLGAGAPNIFDAVPQQLGLKLQKAKSVPVDVVVIDHVDRTPTKN